MSVIPTGPGCWKDSEKTCRVRDAIAQLESEYPIGRRGRRVAITTCRKQAEFASIMTARTAAKTYAQRLTSVPVEGWQPGDVAQLDRAPPRLVTVCGGSSPPVSTFPPRELPPSTRRRESFAPHVYLLKYVPYRDRLPVLPAAGFRFKRNNKTN